MERRSGKEIVMHYDVWLEDVEKKYFNGVVSIFLSGGESSFKN